MTGFIELTGTNGNKAVFNVDSIKVVSTDVDDERTVVITDQVDNDLYGAWYVAETYNEVLDKIHRAKIEGVLSCILAKKLGEQNFESSPQALRSCFAQWIGNLNALERWTKELETEKGGE